MRYFIALDVSQQLGRIRCPVLALNGTFDTQVEADGIAADWHPSEATHTKASQKLADFIKEKIG